MRQSYNHELWTEDNEIIGINLGADFVSEHEWGIDGIKQQLGVHDSRIGIERYSTTQSPETIIVKEDKSLILSLKQPDFFSYKKSLFQQYNIDTKNTTKCMWNSRNFLINSSDEKVKKFLTKLEKAFYEKDVIVFIGTTGPFQNGGLSLVIKSKVPEQFKLEVLAKHKDEKELNEYFKKTKVKEKLKKAGKSFFALYPRWGREEELNNSKYKIICWLNPLEQKQYNYGWYTIEELLEWTQDRGPIPIKK